MQALAKLLADARVRAIGVSNMNEGQIEAVTDLRKMATIEALDTGVRGGPDPAVIGA